MSGLVDYGGAIWFNDDLVQLTKEKLSENHCHDEKNSKGNFSRYILTQENSYELIYLF